MRRMRKLESTSPDDLSLEAYILDIRNMVPIRCGLVSSEILEIIISICMHVYSQVFKCIIDTTSAVQSH